MNMFWGSGVQMVATVDSGEGDGTPLQYSCLENPMDGGAWQAAVHGVAKSQTRLSDFTFNQDALCSNLCLNLASDKIYSPVKQSSQTYPEVCGGQKLSNGPLTVTLYACVESLLD